MEMKVYAVLIFVVLAHIFLDTLLSFLEERRILWKIFNAVAVIGIVSAALKVVPVVWSLR